MAVCGEFSAAGAMPAGRAAAFLPAEQFGGQGAGGRAFAHAFRPGEEIAMRQSPAIQGAAEQTQGFGLADDLGKGHVRTVYFLKQAATKQA